MFVRLTGKNDGGALYVNAAQVRAVAESGDITWVNVGELNFQVVESAKAVVTLLESELNGGVLK